MQAADTKQRASDLITQHEQLIRDVPQQKRDADDLLEEGAQQQQLTDELLANADLARDIALKAVAKAEDLLDDAKRTLKTLEGWCEVIVVVTNECCGV